MPQTHQMPIQAGKIQRPRKVRWIPILLSAIMGYARSPWLPHYWRRSTIKYSESPKSSFPATTETKKGHEEYYSLKKHREGPNTESGELNPDVESKQVKNHNKATANRYEKRWLPLIYLQHFVIWRLLRFSQNVLYSFYLWLLTIRRYADCHD